MKYEFKLKGKMKKLLMPMLLASLFFTSAHIVKGQEIKYKALFLYNFTKHVGWPPDVKTGDFVIGIIGDNAVYKELNEITEGKMTGNQKIVVKRYNSVEEVTNCHILFVSRGQSSSKNMVSIMNKVGNNCTLVVTEEEGSIKKGASINFVVRDEQMKFELSKTNAVEKRLQVGLSLEKLAILIS